MKSPTPKTTPLSPGRRTIFKGATEDSIAKQVKDAFNKMKRKPTASVLYDRGDPELESYRRWRVGEN